MDAHDLERYRGRLLGIAYGILGSMSDAEDVVQETFLRWYRSRPENVRSVEAWLVTVASRLSIDRLRARKKSQYDGPWLPEPVANDLASNPEARAVVEADLSIAFLWMLERLNPEERAALVLREVFGYSYEDISAIFKRRAEACRQLVHRAKAGVRSGAKKHDVASVEKEWILRRFLRALETQDELALLELVAPESRWISDGGGKVVGAGTRILEGRDRVARMAAGLSRKFVVRTIEELGDKFTREIIALLGERAITWVIGGAVVGVTAIDTDGERINGVYNVLNPDKLSRIIL